MGYKNPVITRRYPDLGDDIHVVIRNPLLVPGGKFRELAAGRDENAAGDEDAVSEDNADRMFKFIADLVVGWRVYDPMAPVELDEDGEIVPGWEAPRLPLPATPELIAQLPQAILTDLMEQISKANPQRTPESPGDTGNPS